ncbi:hypothetical protein SAMN05444358_101434 [Ruegeria halocynthiae]|uniref:Uncharacterized protein n=1 Tax=Ruegeria halocynthiae TaxID=985054 RepID=A0A1H2SEC3_9RHOB|nr:hypothetical protein [Ruegeria halocynthiae]SDW29474.1 hypothetical protein SAMN05444358_101434 [Ruegeria halocynthiae]
MAKTLKDLLLALLNATLILLALCLFLGWKLAQSVEHIRSGFAENLQLVAPLREQAQGIRGELTALRSDLATLSSPDTQLDAADRQQLNAALQRLGNVEDKLEDTQARLANLVENPEDLIDHAITTSADRITDRLMTLKGCEPAT